MMISANMKRRFHRGGVFTILIFTMLCPAGCSPSTAVHEQNCIAHAGGIIDGYMYTNSREAVEHAVECGMKYIELDLDVTSDGALVAVHQWTEFRTMAGLPLPSCGERESIDKRQFTESKIYGKFTPLTAEDIVDILDKYPNIFLVTDRISDPEILNSYFENYARRIVVECFSDDDYLELSKLGYTCLRHGHPPFAGLRLIRKLSGLPSVDIDNYVVWFEEWKFYRKFGCFTPSGGKMAVFSVKDRSVADSIFNAHPNLSFIYVNDVEKR